MTLPWPRSSGTPSAVAAGVVFVVVAAALSIGLGAQPVWTLDEARPGLVAREMRETGRWEMPYFGGEVYPEKPPLFYWPIALMSGTRPTEWSLRLPSVVAAAATASVTYLIAAELLAPGAGLVAVAVLASSPGFVEWARTGRMEMLLTLWITLALWSFMRWCAHGRRVDALCAGLWVAFGVMTKGPAGLFPAVAGGLALIGLRGRVAGRPRDLVGGLALGGILILGWGAVAWLFAPGFEVYAGQVAPAFVKEMLARPSRPFGYALWVAAVDFLPWSSALPVAAWLLCRARPDGRRALLPILWWAAVPLLVFSLAVAARPPYLLPVYPPLALSLACTVATLTPGALRWMAVPPALAWVGLGTFSLVVALGPGSIRMGEVQAPVPQGFGVAITFLSAAVVGACYRLVRASRFVGATLIAGAAMLSVVLGFDLAVRAPSASAAYPTPRLAARLAGHLRPGAEVLYVDTRHVTALLFYLRNPVRRAQRPEDIPLMLRGGRGAYALIGESEAAMLRDTLGARLRRIDQVTLGKATYVLVGLDEDPSGAAPTRQPSAARVSSAAS